MDLDTRKAAWHQQQQQLEAPSSSLLLDEVRQARWRLNVQDWAETISWVLMIALAAWIFRDSQSPLGRAGMIVTIASSAWIIVLLHVTGLRKRAARKDSSLQAFFRQELENVDWKIRQRRLPATWYTLPPAAGLVLWFASLRPSALEWAGAAAVALVAFLYSRWMRGRRIRIELLPIREELDQHGRALGGNGSQTA